ncbi:hypothetical protein PHLGIDRAFT_51998, partial [Phlebiopsis gigantea 11061_1 CR5-6]
VHPASLIHPSLHPPPLLELLNIDISYDLVRYVTDHVASITCYGMDWPSTRRSSLSRRANLFSFISHVLITANIQTPGLLVTLSYIDKAKLFLQVSNDLWACERVFLGALILAHKYCNDHTMKNMYWSRCTGVFGKRDVGIIEREFLQVLDYKLSFHESDLLSHHSAIMSL